MSYLLFYNDGSDSIMQNYWLIIPAAGSGKRMQSGVPKQYLKLQQHCVIEHAVTAFLPLVNLQKIVIALAQDDTYWAQTALAADQRVLAVKGGDSRMVSVYQALLAIQNQAQAHDWILTHDAARPNIRWADIKKLTDTCELNNSGAILATPVTATLKQVDQQKLIYKTVLRDNLWQALTPQCFRYDVLLKALRHVLASNIQVTDEAMAVELFDQPVQIVAGRADNIKITYPEDLALLEFLMTKQ